MGTGGDVKNKQFYRKNVKQPKASYMLELYIHGSLTQAFGAFERHPPP